MATLVELQARLDRLQAARALGAREVRCDDRTVVYGSDAELAAAIADVQQQILQASGVSMAHTIRIAAAKGLES